MDIKIEVPVKHHVKKYLQHYYGEEYRVSQVDHMGVWLFNLLRKEKKNGNYDQTVEKYPTSWNIYVSDSSWFDNGIRGVSSITASRLNKYVETLMKHELRSLLLNLLNRSDINIKIQNEIHRFRLKYAIEEHHLSTDALVKDFYRYRKTRENRAICPLNSRL